MLATPSIVFGGAERRLAGVLRGVINSCAHACLEPKTRCLGCHEAEIGPTSGDSELDRR